MDKIKEYENRIENLEKLNINLNDEYKKMELKYKGVKIENENLTQQIVKEREVKWETNEKIIKEKEEIIKEKEEAIKENEKLKKKIKEGEEAIKENEKLKQIIKELKKIILNNEKKEEKEEKGQYKKEEEKEGGEKLKKKEKNKEDINDGNFV